MTILTSSARTADDLFGTMAAIRRTSRRLSERPVLLSALTGAQLELVRLVRRRPGLSVADAAEELRLAPNTVSTLVGQLTEAGVLHRLADPADRRVARLELEPETRRKVTAWRDRRVVALASAVGRLSPLDQKVLAEALPALGRLSEAFERQEADR